ncbi:Protein of unknown function DUF262 [Chitinophaga eiseniae]|uniref:GmrSD restriction endonucleases N-terminal domain-containing protein n=1 Tax=Chitinophaga eiseniae TaxID=634771 RepID=A0A1T4U1T9_9BACT|nr:DUF262 domain-containing protein [Chitinophaga eiseniae]SKA46712.1 Protein of unknown function DUF262 [Chitinophaga eiseniae]
MTAINKLQFSIPANNQKVIELYNKVKRKELETSPRFQRKLVWRKQHKFNFIDTILNNYPFPEIYISQGELDTEKMTIVDNVVDGQQRLNTIIDYIDEKGVFSQDKIPVPKFSELEREAKEGFLNYEVSVRYLKNVNRDQVGEIFRRINSTEYSLNTTEIKNAEWGDSEFICFAKQIVEKELDGVDIDLVAYKLNANHRKQFLDFFHLNEIFSENDINRMLSLQFIMTLVATLCEEQYFNRNLRVQHYVETYFDEFSLAPEVEERLLKTVVFIESLKLPPRSYWFNKANIFTLIVELYKYETSFIDTQCLVNKLRLLEIENNQYILDLSENNHSEIPQDRIRYFETAKEGVNEKSSREYRGGIVNEFISGCLLPDQ